jgi:hypothetical protein
MDLTPEYATEFVNFNMNSTGGITTIDAFGTSQSFPIETSANTTLGKFHELVKKDGTSIIFSQIDKHLVAITSSMTNVAVTATTFTNLTNLRSVQMGERLIFMDGTSRNFFTTDGSTFSPLLALIEQGQANSTPTSATVLVDTDITNWFSQSKVVTNDLVHNVTKGGFGIVTGIFSAAITHTRIDASALGIGALSAAATAQEVGDFYNIQDLTELNIIPTPIGNDNVAVAGTNTSATGIYFTAAGTKLNWANTEIRKGDYILNTTRNAVTEVTAITTSVLRTAGLSTMVAGDSLVFLKSAMPISDAGHIHFGRLYMIDSRDKTKIRITGANDPQDMTVDAGTLDAATFQFGTLQPEADFAVGMGSFQRFFVLGGSKNVYLFEGDSPIIDVSSNSEVIGQSRTQDFNIVGIFPQGIVGPDSMISIGNDLLFVTRDGVQSISLGSDSSTLNRADISEQVKTSFVNGSVRSIVHFPENSWILFNIVDATSRFTYCYNYHPYLGRNQLAQTQRGQTVTPTGGTWQKFTTSAFSPLNYFVNTSGRFIGIQNVSAPTGAKLMEYALNGPIANFTAVMRTAWLTLDEPKETNSLKEGVYLTTTQRLEDTNEPFTTNITWSVTAFSSEIFDGFDLDAVDFGGGKSTDRAVTTLSSSMGELNHSNTDYNIFKEPLMWRGSRVRFTVSARVSNSIVTLSRMQVQFNEYGNS